MKSSPVVVSAIRTACAALCLAAFLSTLSAAPAQAMSKQPVKTQAMEQADQLMPEALESDINRLTADYRELKGRLSEADNQVLDVERRIASEATQAGKDALSSLRSSAKAEQARLIQEAESKKIELDYLRERLKAKIKEYRD